MYSDDVLALNPELQPSVTYRTKAERTRKANARPDGYRSQLEADYAAQLSAQGIAFHYEVLNLNIGEDLAYTPDFDYTSADGVFTVVELKGNSKMKNARDSLTRFKVAAALYPRWRWLWIESGQIKYHYGA